MSESATKPHVIVVAGPNGAGKSTSAPSLLRDALEVREFVNADAIAGGLSAFSPRSVAITAGRIMLERMRELASEGEDFAFDAPRPRSIAAGTRRGSVSVDQPDIWRALEGEYGG